MRRAYAMPTTRIASCKSTYNILTTEAHNTKNVVGFKTCFKGDLRPIYTVRLCRMRLTYHRPTAQIVSGKSNLQLAYDCRVCHKKCRTILKHVLRLIYTVRLCRMRLTYHRPTAQIVSCKSNLQLAYDCRVRHKKCRTILKHVLKSYDNRRYRQC